MLAEPAVMSHNNWLAIASKEETPNGYFRSKLYVASCVNNPLIAAASPLLSFLERLNISSQLPPIEGIRENIAHELNAFHSRLSIINYAGEFIKMANYLLSATIDELLGKNYLRLYGHPVNFKAFTPPSNDNIGPEYRFFEIIEYIKQSAMQCLDLIELAYHCLITGFEGEHHQRSNGRQVLDHLIEELYQLIQQHRVNKPIYLFSEQEPNSVDEKKYKSLIINSLSAILLVLTGYFGSYSVLDHFATKLLFSPILST